MDKPYTLESHVQSKDQKLNESIRALEQHIWLGIQTLQMSVPCLPHLVPGWIPFLFFPHSDLWVPF